MIFLALWLVHYSSYVKDSSPPCQGVSMVIITTSPATYFRPDRCVTYEPIEFSASPSQQAVYRKQIGLKEGGGTLQELVDSIREDWE
jgi:hypothetical protein